MTNEERDIQRKLRILQHAEKIGNARKACRYFGVGRSSFYRWRDAYQKHDEVGLKNAESIPKNPANQTPTEIVEKVTLSLVLPIHSVALQYASSTRARQFEPVF